jgi:hypothetical protein
VWPIGFSRQNEEKRVILSEGRPEHIFVHGAKSAVAAEVSHRVEKVGRSTLMDTSPFLFVQLTRPSQGSPVRRRPRAETIAADMASE